MMFGLLSTHALSGCDTAVKMFGIEKKETLKVASKLPLAFLSQEEASKDQYLSESRKFVAGCYGAKNESSSNSRYTIYNYSR